MAVVGADGVANGIAVVAYKCFEFEEVVTPLTEAGVGLRQISRTLALQRAFQEQWRYRMELGCLFSYISNSC